MQNKIPKKTQSDQNRKIEIAIYILVDHKLKRQTDTWTITLHKNFKLNLKLKPQLRSTSNCLRITKWYKSRSQREVKEIVYNLDNNLRRGRPLALPVVQTSLCKLRFERGQRSLFFKQIFMSYVPVYNKTRKEIISMSAGKSVDMTDINHGHNIVN